MEEIYFANLRQINKLRGVIEEWRIQIEQLKSQKWEDELKQLHLDMKTIQMKIDEYALKQLLKRNAEVEEKMKSKE
jgi:hypothetical protein